MYGGKTHITWVDLALEQICSLTPNLNNSLTPPFMALPPQSGGQVLKTRGMNSCRTSRQPFPGLVVPLCVGCSSSVSPESNQHTKGTIPARRNSSSSCYSLFAFQQKHRMADHRTLKLLKWSFRGDAIGATEGVATLDVFS